jgi:hypothetical protein
MKRLILAFVIVSVVGLCAFESMGQEGQTGSAPSGNALDNASVTMSPYSTVK